MKKSLLLASALAMVLGVGVAVGARQENNARAEQVEAAAITTFSRVYRFTAPAEYWGDTVYVYAWGDEEPENAAFPGVNISSEFSYNESSRKVYTYATNNTNYQYLIFSNKKEAEGRWQTNNITIGDNRAWYLDNGNTPGTWTPADQTYYLYDENDSFGDDVKCYAKQSSGSLTNAASEPGVSMTKVQYASGQLYSITLDPAFDQFKLSDGTHSTGFEFINQNRGNCFKWDGSAGTWDSNLNYVKAVDWVYQSMHMRDISTTNNADTNACRAEGTGAKSYYATAKTNYQHLSDDVKNEFQYVDKYNDAKARFVAWAAANGEEASFAGTALTVNTAVMPLGITTHESANSTTIIIIVAATIAAISAGVFFILKKKHN